MRRIARIEVARLLELEEGFLLELEQEALVMPDEEGFYDAACVERARLCCTLHRELGINIAGVEVLLDVLDRWRTERRRTRELLILLRGELDRRGG